MNAMTGYKLARVALGLAIALCCAPSSACAAAPLEVRFTVTGCWGTPIPSTVLIQVYSESRQTVWHRLYYPAEDVLSLEGGRYHAVIEANGFFPASPAIEVLDRDVELRTCLTLAPISGTTRP